MKTLQLNADTTIPILGFGTWQLTDEDAVRSVNTALEVGYRHIDTAEAYGNQSQIGKVIADAGLKRDDLFITSKVWYENLKHDDLINACNKTLQELQTDYLDLYLIHWPNRQISMEESLGTMQELKQAGKIKSIGVSNFNIHHLQDALATDVQIDNNQVEFHPTLNQQELLDFCRQHDIQLTAYSPLGKSQDLQLEQITKIAAKYEVTPAEVILNWLMQQNIIAIPRSANPEHIKQNFHATQWQLEDEDIAIIDKLNSDNRIIDPSFGDFNY